MGGCARAAVSVDPTPRTRPRHPATQVASTPARRARPAASETLVPMRSAPTQRVACFGSSPAQRTKRGEPLRERRLWRSRRKAGRAARSRWVDDEAARGTRSPTRFAPPEAVSAVGQPALKQKTGATRTPIRCQERRSVKLGADLADQLDRAVHITVRDARANGADHVVQVARRDELRGDRLDISGRERSRNGAAMT